MIVEKALKTIDDTAAWSAVLARDARMDGRFVYAVASTGIYCRPSCPSRRPRRDGVRFFPEPGEAERAGFRACRRCRPADGAASPATRAVERACAFLDEHLEEPVTLEELGRAAGLSPHHLQRTFKRLTGVSPREYAAARRMERLKGRLREGDDVTSATYEAGFGSASRVYERSDARLGMTPGSYRRGGAGLRVRWSAAACPLGRVLVAVTERGVCAILLGETDEELEAALSRELPGAELERDGAGREGAGGSAPGEPLDRVLLQVVRHLEGSEPHLALPLDVRATAFQERVWKALQEIPTGETRTYGEVAAAIGRPGAARAVGRACGANPTALAVPCHRVVRGDGEPGGWRWGAERKRRLLARERADRC